ncbi:MAG: hypothetical protein A2705_05010 [Omnitrophica WOR_2 bacterium RIFCSPHIGHO2_01_FULL_52_10]|nr:MAG: hypothetical protein A2705_05010 [Omnitrophica WOR_2 bacterium RIFCSPHIGHO2_01_FULL_52_10]
MYYFHILKCKDSTKYYGHTGDLVQRLSRHSKGGVKSTRNKLPLELVYPPSQKTTGFARG